MGDKHQYLVYGAEWCGYCKMAVNLLSAKGHSYTYADCGKDEEFLLDVKNFYNTKTIPLIMSIDKNTGLVKKVGGYTDLIEFLKNDG